MKLLPKTILDRILSKIEELYEHLATYHARIQALRAVKEADFVYAANYYMPLMKALRDLITDYFEQHPHLNKAGADEIALQIEMDLEDSDRKKHFEKLMRFLEPMTELMRAYNNKLDTVAPKHSKHINHSLTAIGMLVSLELTLYRLVQKQKIEFACKEYNNYLVTIINKRTQKWPWYEKKVLTQLEIDNLAIRFATNDAVMRLIENYVAVTGIQKIIKKCTSAIEQVGEVSQKFYDQADKDFTELKQYNIGSQTDLFLQRIAKIFDSSVHVSEPTHCFFKRLSFSFSAVNSEDKQPSPLHCMN